MLLATSCSKDELDTASSGNEAQVTFSLGLEGHIATRAISDGKSADKLVYAVFDENGNRITGIEQIEKTGVSFPTTETLVLAKGQTYKVAFWAQDADCSAYDVADDMNVTVSYEGANNDETRDAFFKTETFTVTGSTSIDVELKRPFAQINVGVEETDWTAAVASGITIQNSSVTIQNAATKINLVTGAVSEPTKVTYSLATIPVEDLKVDVNGDKNIGDGEIYKWLSMSYILVDDESETEGVQGAGKATLEGLKFTFQPENGNEITLEDGLNSVPVQRNWRTNILGKLLTGDITFNISIDEMYEDDHIYPNGSAQELAMAAANGGEVILEENVELKQTIIVANGNALTVNLNGHSIVNTNQSANATTGVFVVESGSKLTIQGEGTIDGGSGSASNLAVWAYPDSEVNISGGTFTVGKDKDGDGNSTIYTTGGTINISGGTFKTECDDTKYILNVGQTQGATGTIIVTGGTFIGYDPATGDDNLGGSFVAEGYTSVKVAGTDNNYAVVPASDAPGENTVAAVDATSLAAAASSNESQTIVLTQDIELDQALTFNGDVVLDGGEDNNVSITGKPLSFQGENTTIKGIKFNNGTTGTESSMYFSNNNTKKVLIEECEFLNAKWDNIQLTKAEESVTIRNCTFKNTEQGYRYIHLEIRDNNKYATTEATLEITGCTFENVSTSYCEDSAITILGFFMKNMTISNNTVKGDGADNLTTSIIWICDGTNFNALMSIDDINKAFKYAAE